MQILKSHPDFYFATAIYRKLSDLGYKTYFAGGCVRDSIMGRSCHDIDLATSARPEKIISLFDKVIDVGKDFGSVKIVGDKGQIDVTTFRADGDYADGRRPKSVNWSSEKEDALRRDFTINSLFWDPDRDQVIDFVGGLDDIKNKIIKTNGMPSVRFKEDYLRMLRAVRFHYQLGFKLEDSVIESIFDLKENIKQVSKERITEELNKIFLNCELRLDFSLLCKTEILKPLGFNLNEAKVLNFSKRTHETSEVIYKWFEFFVFFYQKNEKKDFTSCINQFVFSKDQKKILFYLTEKLKKTSGCNNLEIGEWIELSYETDGDYLIRFLSFHKMLPSSLVYLLNEQNNLKEKPKPYLVFDDIKNKNFKSASKVLKNIYWKQLEGFFKNKEEVLSYLDKVEVGEIKPTIV